MAMKDFAELKSLRDKLKEDERLRAIEKAERERRERIAREHAVEFRSAVTDVVKMPESDRYVWRPMHEFETRGQPLPTRPRTLEEETAAVLRESMLSDQFDVDGLLDEDPSLSWSAPGVGPDVVKKLRKRHWPVEDELDLHGLTRDDARRHVDSYLRRSNKRGIRCVRILSAEGFVAKNDFFAYDASLRTGVRVAAVDADGDGKFELVVGAGVGGGPHIRVLNALTGQDAGPGSFWGADPNSRAGFYVSGAVPNKR